ncbi:MAG: S23 ribosomal protein [Parcubacteria group bacterium GW2011_GWA2_47_10]|nr:MAG: S23 ribosomal protein [Parcubacteria group bacterium GW2011_GWA2_47_10]
MQDEDFINRLDVIKTADDLVLAVYKSTKDFPKEELFGLVSQMRRAAVSVPANIVEGYSRNGKKEKLQFYYISKGSLAELRYFVNLVFKLSYIDEAQKQELNGKIEICGRLLSGFMGYTNRQLPIARLDSSLDSVEPRRTARQANRSSDRTSGQTLIETVVAIFVLAMGLTSGLALAVYAFAASSNTIERVTATALAREGVEIARRMRDSNWLQDDIINPDSGNCNTMHESEYCFDDWLDGQYDIYGQQSSSDNCHQSSPSSCTAGMEFRMRFDPTSNVATKWNADRSPNDSLSCRYRIYLRSGGGLANKPASVSCPPPSGTWTATSYFRKVNIIHVNTSTQDNESQVLIRSMVWWYGKRCNNSTSNNSLLEFTDYNITPCKVVVEEYLTNWKNYEF